MNTNNNNNNNLGKTEKICLLLTSHSPTTSILDGSPQQNHNTLGSDFSGSATSSAASPTRPQMCQHLTTIQWPCSILH